MSLIHELIQFLPAAEYERLRAVSLSGKELLMMNILMEHRDKEYPGNEYLCRQLSIQNHYCDKIKSVLLDKSLGFLAGDDDPAAIIAYSARYLVSSGLALRLARPYVRKAKEFYRGKPQELHHFYSLCFNMIHVVPTKFYNEKLMKEMGRLYIDSAADKTYARLYAELRITWSTMYNLGAKGRMTEEKNYQRFKKEMDALYVKLKAHPNDYLFYTWYYNFGSFYNQRDQGDLALNAFQQAEKIIRKNRKLFSPDQLLQVRLKQAESLYFNDEYEKAQKLMYELSRDPLFSKVSNRIYFASKLVQLCCITGEWEQGRQVLEEFHRPHLNLEHSVNRIMSAIHFAKYYLIYGELDAAYEMLLLLKQILDKNVYVQYEIEMRNMEIAYFFMKGEYEFVKSLARKNIKFLDSKGMGIKNSTFPYFYKLCLSFVKMIQSRYRWTEEDEKMYVYTQGGSYIYYGRLLEQMRKEAETAQASDKKKGRS